jgi:hypothetical protein
MQISDNKVESRKVARGIYNLICQVFNLKDNKSLQDVMSIPKYEI